MGKRFVNATGEVEKIRLVTESKRDFSFDVFDLVCIKIEIFFLLCMYFRAQNPLNCIFENTLF